MRSVSPRKRRRLSAKAPWPQLPWSEDFLLRFGERVVLDLPVPYRQACKRFLRSHGTLRWGSACSGTECPLWAFSALQRCLDFTAKHVYSAEVVTEKRSWITTIAGLHAYLFADIMDISRPEAVCSHHGQVQPLSCCAVDIYVAGFSCKDVSVLNNGRASHSGCTQSFEGTTGLTFWGSLLVLDRYHPSAFVLENVPGILCYQQLERTIEMLSRKGYVVTWSMQNPLQAGTPHDRDRVWIIGFRADTVSHIRNFVQGIDALWASLLANRHSVGDIDTFLYSQDHPHVRQRQEAHMATFENNVEKAGFTFVVNAPTRYYTF